MNIPLFSSFISFHQRFDANICDLDFKLLEERFFFLQSEKASADSANLYSKIMSERRIYPHHFQTELIVLRMILKSFDLVENENELDHLYEFNLAKPLGR